MNLPQPSRGWPVSWPLAIYSGSLDLSLLQTAKETYTCWLLSLPWKWLHCTVYSWGLRTFSPTPKCTSCFWSPFWFIHCCEGVPSSKSSNALLSHWQPLLYVVCFAFRVELPNLQLEKQQCTENPHQKPEGPHCMLFPSESLALWGISNWAAGQGFLSPSSAALVQKTLLSFFQPFISFFIFNGDV